MAHYPLPPVDDMTLREWNMCTSTLEDTISFCQSVKLIPYRPTAPCSNGHNNWYMGKCSKIIDGYHWRCRVKECRLSRSIRDGTFFANSKLEIQQVLDLIFIGLKESIPMTFFVDIANLRVSLLSHPGIIGGVGHVAEIDESA
ncbi:unnamed protein product [Didymodactylos carnosus]|uniref:Uncharacterized protein n=1 Tax=Didymodactylos carnosus TaxID=1234261 RepID=A0A814ZF87_9BILA|nr:unnamed protein product [Didymodactylos carnosus]CAF4004198.1 unnamed protein product [Didymodactylos carnosus]